MVSYSADKVSVYFVPCCFRYLCLLSGGSSRNYCLFKFVGFKKVRDFTCRNRNSCQSGFYSIFEDVVYLNSACYWCLLKTLRPRSEYRWRGKSRRQLRSQGQNRTAASRRAKRLCRIRDRLLFDGIWNSDLFLMEPYPTLNWSTFMTSIY